MGSPEDNAEPLLPQNAGDLESSGADAEVGLHAVEEPPSLTSFPTGHQIAGELGRQWTLALPVLITVFLQVCSVVVALDFLNFI